MRRTIANAAEVLYRNAAAVRAMDASWQNNQRHSGEPWRWRVVDFDVHKS